MESKEFGVDHLNKEEKVGDSSRSKGPEVEGQSSGSENMKNENDHDDLTQAEKKQNDRYTSEQIQRMESFYQEHPNPNKKQRLRLSKELGLSSRQVKFWFQNRKTQTKAHDYNLTLCDEYEHLKAENDMLRMNVKKFSCISNCSGSSGSGDVARDNEYQRLRSENARLREQLARIYISTETSRRLHHREEASSSTLPFPIMPSPESESFKLLDSEISLARKLAVHASDHVLRMSREGEPLWTRVGGRGPEVLNMKEHGRIFHWPVKKIRPRNHNSRIEASRESALVFSDVVGLVNALMDADKWMMMFPSLVARASTVQVISRGVGTDPNGQVQLMHAEFMYPSPLLPSRECYYLRACRRAPEGMWVVVDFPIDGFSFARTHESALAACFRRYPSGAVIDKVINGHGYCKATWIEHVEVEDRALHPIFSPLLQSGEAFFAQRWMASLQRYGDRSALTSPHTFLGNAGIITTVEGRNNLMHLSHRMVRMFCVGITTALLQAWAPPRGSSPKDSTTRMATRMSSQSGHPNGTILSAVSAVWLPFCHFQVFEFLRSEKSRSKLGALYGGSTYHEVSRISTGPHPGTCISLLSINDTSSPVGSSSMGASVLLQESFSDRRGGIVSYAWIGGKDMETVMASGDTSGIPLLPCGFSIVPASSNGDGIYTVKDSRSGRPRPALFTTGCILTVAFQMLAGESPDTEITTNMVSSFNNRICDAVRQIKDALRESAGETFSSRKH